MKEYKMVCLNKGMSLTVEKDLEKAEMTLNELVKEGWELQQVVTPNDGMGHIIAVLYREIYW